ncbi:hypothetical protein [Sphingosinicella sp. CPCC 101087]|uniref:hypothetical protein n=1 Tax=Sphingosinicella sp. CPCC 101087 TaxID=2497754 RepID=UPI00101CF964|nr:hypothetical protein [Sphingosinicella sp. CPCC 101087]
MTLGDYFGFQAMYAREGNSSGYPTLGSLSAEPIAGQTVDFFISSSSTQNLTMVGNTSSAITIAGVYIDGHQWPVIGVAVIAGSTRYTLDRNGADPLVAGINYDFEVVLA